MLTIGRPAFLRGTTEEFWWGMRCHFGPLTCLCKLYERLRRIYPPILVPELTNETWTRLFWSLFWNACRRQQPNGCKGSLRHCVAVNMGVLLCIMRTYAYHQHCTVHFLLCDQSYLPFSLGPVPFHDFSRPLGRNSKRTSSVGHGRTTSFEVIKHVKNGWFQAHL